MLRSPYVYASLAALSLATLGGSLVVGCGSDTETTPTPPPSATSKDPPAKPADGVKGDGAGQTFAVEKLFLGDTDRTGSPNADAWELYGYNLDGKVSDATSTDLCKPRAGALPKTVKTDGKGGLDNAFGKLLMPIIGSLASDATVRINENIADGSFTILMKLDTLGGKANYIDIPAALFVGTQLGGPAKFDGSDKWPIVPELLSDPKDLNSSKVKFPASYVANNTWVSGSKSDLDLQLSVAGFSLTLNIANAIITMDLAGDRKAATNGIIAGVIPVEPLIAQLKKIAGGFSPELCTGSTFESIAESIRQAADILEDGSQNPSKECNAISIGLGFEAKPAQLGTVSDPTPPTKDPCDPANMTTTTTTTGGGAGGAGGAGQGGAGGAG
ncbi:MAG: hypothetical protein FJ096_17915 [Deltaproteobacteria bacterium]|nr:hypothetical protein [Deltaproteobacteria bacterium]